MPKEIDQETKAEAISMLILGKSDQEIKAKCDVGHAYIAKLRNEIEDKPVQVASYLDQVRHNLGDMIAKSLSKHLSAMDSIAEVASDERYIRGESAKDIAELHSRLEQWTLSILQASHSLGSTASANITVQELPEGKE